MHWQLLKNYFQRTSTFFCCDKTFYWKLWRTLRWLQFPCCDCRSLIKKCTLGFNQTLSIFILSTIDVMQVNADQEMSPKTTVQEKQPVTPRQAAAVFMSPSSTIRYSVTKSTPFRSRYVSHHHLFKKQSSSQVGRSSCTLFGRKTAFSSASMPICILVFTHGLEKYDGRKS